MTDSAISFDPVFELRWLLLALGISAIIVIWIEWKKPQRFLSARLFAVIIILIAISALLFRPQFARTKTESVILLTEGFSASQADSIFDVYPKAKIISTDFVNFKRAEQLPNANALETVNNQLDFVVGYGLPKAMQDIVGNNKFYHVYSHLPDGLLDIKTPGNVSANQRTEVTGIINNSFKDQQIILEGPGGKEDSVTINQTGIQPFTLSFTPKQKGNFLYAITTHDQKERIPIHVSEKKSLKILFLQLYPTFETRYLKTLLAKDHIIQVRYELSKNVFRFENFNAPSEEFKQVSSTLLKKFDLLIVDTEILQSLSSKELKTIQDEVRTGLGMIVVLNESPLKNKRLKTFLPYGFSAYPTDTAVFHLGGKKINLPAWPVQPEQAAKLMPLLKNKNRVLTGYRYDGFGKIGFQLLQETYRVALEGDSSAYQQIWSSLLERTARTSATNSRLKIISSVPVFPDEPVEIEVISNDESPSLFVDSVRVSLIENTAIDGVWTAKVWFDKTGWHELQVNDESTQHLYVSEANSLKSVENFNRILRTTQNIPELPTKRELIREYKPVPSLIFFLIFLLAAGFLWLVPKI
jgi:hypothetical protein